MDLHEPILQWYADHARDLPWRHESCSAWGVLVSEVMLQQTPVARVLPAWVQWMERWPTPRDLALAPAGDAVRAWGRLGYPRRALRLHQCATVITEEHGGVVPTTEATLLTLPGVGTYTAAAVACFAHGERTVVVDTNVRRVQARAVTGVALPAPSLSRAETAVAASLVPTDPAVARVWNVAVMELGALVCTARSPRCGQCPVADRCVWRRAGSPPYDGPARKAQGWAGTDRQIRGAMMAVLRASDGPVRLADLAVACPDDEVRRMRCLDGLVSDGLVEPVGRGRYRLPA
ncbi:A/G-specific adenine glycosylase [Arsenicicoccus sp. oral taxon 190]|uniref:A/G-specific adenine glycosylase n=1 Tax=Arsenicicoccus sp. oral taxon 190 TaxID=1658671 RepID=UPI00067A2915|nr:A/G-specific adenine glycosylase [Arsenicicoccus sp. oral taxon 190]AKT51180.1 adenine glycosylase [Arsenicicoccus sp. oral taxon 190]